MTWATSVGLDSRDHVERGTDLGADRRSNGVELRLELRAGDDLLRIEVSQAVLDLEVT
jgi:hypothetical protein